MAFHNKPYSITPRTGNATYTYHRFQIEIKLIHLLVRRTITIGYRRLCRTEHVAAILYFSAVLEVDKMSNCVKHYTMIVSQT